MKIFSRDNKFCCAMESLVVCGPFDCSIFGRFAKKMISSIFYFFKLPGTPASESSYEEVESRPDLLFILGRERFCWRVAASTATLKSQFVSKKNFVVEKICFSF